MNSSRYLGLVVAMVAGFGYAPAAFSESPAILVDPTAKSADVKTMTSKDLKAAIHYAAENGDLEQKDATEMINKITDIETLMDQFDFIRDHQHRMISSVNSSFH